MLCLIGHRRIFAALAELDEIRSDFRQRFPIWTERSASLPEMLIPTRLPGQI